MATYSTSLKLTLIGDGEQTGTWGQTTNTNLGTLLEQAIVGQTTITMANADYTLSDLNGVTDEARNAVIIVTGNQNATYSVIVPAVQKLYMVTNSLSSSAIAYIKPSGGSTFQVPNGRTMCLYCTGTAFVALDYVSYAQNIISGGTITTGAINCTSLTSSGAISGTTIGGTTITAATQFTGPGTGLTGTAASLTVGNATLAAGLTGTPNITVGTVNGTTITASTQFSGPGTGLTGTAASLTVGNATTAATVSTTVASGAVGTTQTAGTNNTTIATTAFVQTAIASLYPVGSIYSSTVATNPNTLFGFGTWTAFAAGRVMIGNGGGFSAGATGGSADAIVVSHTHTGNTGAASNGHTHNFSGTTGGQSANHTHANSQGGSGVLGPLGNLSGVEEAAGAPDYFLGDMSVNSVDHNHSFSGVTGDINQGHTHAFTTDSTGSSATNANLQPYIVVYMWNRTA